MYLLTAVVLSLSITGQTTTQSSMKIVMTSQKQCEDIAALLIKTNRGINKPGSSHTTIAFCAKQER